MGRILISLIVLISCTSKGNNEHKNTRKTRNNKIYKIVINDKEINIKDDISSFNFNNFANITIPKDEQFKLFIKNKELENGAIISKDCTIVLEDIENSKRKIIDIKIEDEFVNFKKEIFDIVPKKKGLKLSLIIDNELKEKLFQNFEYILIKLNDQKLEDKKVYFNDGKLVIENKDLDLGLNNLEVLLVKKYTGEEIQVQNYEYIKKHKKPEGLQSPFKGSKNNKNTNKIENVRRSLSKNFDEIDEDKFNEEQIDFKLKVFSRENEDGYIWDLKGEENIVETTIEVSLREEDKEKYKLFVNNKEFKDGARIKDKAEIKLVHILSNIHKEKSIEVKRENLNLKDLFEFNYDEFKLSLKPISPQLKEHLKKRFHKLTLKLDNLERVKDAFEYFEESMIIDIRKEFKDRIKENNKLTISLSEFIEDNETTLKTQFEFKESFNLNIENAKYDIKKLSKVVFKQNLKISLENKEDELFVNGNEINEKEAIIKNSSKISIKRKDREIKETLTISKLDIDVFKSKNIASFNENSFILSLSIDKEDISDFKQFENLILLINKEEIIFSVRDFENIELNLYDAPYNINQLGHDIEIKISLQEFYSKDRKEIQSLKVKKDQIEQFNLKEKEERENLLKAKILESLNTDRDNLLEIINNPLNREFIENVRFDYNKTLAHLICETKYADLIDLCEGLKALINEKDMKGRISPYYLSMKDNNFYIWNNIISLLNYNNQDNDGKKLLDLAADQGEDKVFALLLNKTEVENSKKLYKKILKDENITKLRALTSRGLVAELSEYYLDNGENFLHKFVREGKVELAKFLLENKIIEINSLTQDNRNVLHIIANNFNKELKDLFENYKEQLKSLVNKNLYEIKESGTRVISPQEKLVPLYYAIEAHNKEAVDYLLELDANVNIYFVDIHSLIFATQKALEKEDLNIVYKLAENMIVKENGNSKELEYVFSFLQDATYPLSEGCKTKRYKIVLTEIAEAGNKKLFNEALNFARRKNLKIEFYYPKTPLHYAIDFNMKELFNEFLAKKSEYYGCYLINYEDSSKGQEIVPIAIYALQQKRFEFLKDILKNENFKFKSETSEDNYFYPFNNSFLHELAKVKEFDKEHKEILEICLNKFKHKINEADFQDDEGKSPLLYFIKNGNIDAVEKLLFLDTPFSLRFTDREGRNIFHFACMLEYENVEMFNKTLKNIIIGSWKKEKASLEESQKFEEKEQLSKLYSLPDFNDNIPKDLLKSDVLKRTFGDIFTDHKVMGTPQDKKTKKRIFFN